MSTWGYVAGSIGLSLMAIGFVLFEAATAPGIFISLCGMGIFAITAHYEGYL